MFSFFNDYLPVYLPYEIMVLVFEFSHHIRMRAAGVSWLIIQ